MTAPHPDTATLSVAVRTDAMIELRTTKKYGEWHLPILPVTDAAWLRDELTHAIDRLRAVAKDPASP